MRKGQIFMVTTEFGFSEKHKGELTRLLGLGTISNSLMIAITDELNETMVYYARTLVLERIYKRLTHQKEVNTNNYRKLRI